MKKILPLIFLTFIGCEQYKRVIGVDEGKSGELSGAYILLASGQSNMWWSKEKQEFPPHRDLILVNKTKTGPGYYAALELVKQNPSLHLTLIQCAEGGTSLSEHMPGSTIYRTCIDLVKQEQAKGAGPVLGMLFYQGETDARYNLGWSLWGDDFSSYMASIRHDIGASIPVVFAQIGQWENVNKFPNWDPFKAMQENIRIYNSAMIKTDDQPTVDGEHHGMEANKIIGSRFAKKLTEILIL